MKLYRTRLFDLGSVDHTPQDVYVGQGWQVHLHSREIRATNFEEARAAADAEGDPVTFRGHRYTADGGVVLRLPPELVIRARSRQRAQQVLNLVTASYQLLEGGTPFAFALRGDMHPAIPLDPNDPEGLSSAEIDAASRNHLAGYDWAKATAIAAKASRRRALTVALVGFAVSALFTTHTGTADSRMTESAAL